MYSTKLENHRYEVECVVVSNVIKIPVLIVDTGAQYSCCHYMDIDERLKEIEVQALETNMAFLNVHKDKTLYFYGDDENVILT